MLPKKTASSIGNRYEELTHFQNQSCGLLFGNVGPLKSFCQNTWQLYNILWFWFLKRVTSSQCTLVVDKFPNVTTFSFLA